MFNKGIGEFGQLCRPFCYDRVFTTTQDLIPALVPIEAAIDVFACGLSSFIVTASGIYASGNNAYGELGLGDVESRYHPTLIEAFKDKRISQVAGGMHHCLFLDDSGVVYASGRNDDGQLGLGYNQHCHIPTLVKFESKIKSVSAGTSGQHSCI